MAHDNDDSLSFFDHAGSDPGFAVVMRGYDRNQVDDHVRRLGSDLSTAIANRESAERRTAQLEQRAVQLEQRAQAADKRAKEYEAKIKELIERVESLQADLRNAEKQLGETGQPTFAGLGGRMEQLLRLAEEEASEIIAAAERDAAEIRGRIDGEVGGLR